jgi:hypothetical protein
MKNSMFTEEGRTLETTASTGNNDTGKYKDFWYYQNHEIINYLKGNNNVVWGLKHM